MKKLILILFLLPLPALADSPRAGLERLSECVAKSDGDQCRESLTASSQPLYAKLEKYDLMRCLPADVRYDSEKKKGSWRIVRAYSDSMGDKRRYLKLWMAEEEGLWKLDVPASLEASLGQNWQKTVDGTEQLYVFTQEQMGTPLGCTAVEMIAQRRMAKR